MTIVDIQETKNPLDVAVRPIKEKMDIFVPGIKNKNIPNRNGMICAYVGAGGSGKTSLMLNMFKDPNCYKGVFHNIFYICPEGSFLSVVNHPFDGHDKVFHELSVPLLEEIMETLKVLKSQSCKEKDKIKIKGVFAGVEDDEDESEDEKEISYNCVIIDDFADALKDPGIAKQLRKMLVKSRHYCCSYIFTLQSYLYFPKDLRKQITNLIQFKPNNEEEWQSVVKELIKMKPEDERILHGYCFDKEYNHLDVDKLSGEFYKNFNKLNIIKKQLKDK